MTPATTPTNVSPSNVATKSEPKAVSPDRAAAEWVLSVGGKVGVMVPATDGSWTEMTGLTQLEKLPKGTLRLTLIEIRDKPSIASTEFARLSGIMHLASITLWKVPHDAKILSYIKDSPSLSRLDLYPESKVPIFTDDDVAILTRWPNLVTVGIRATTITDRSLPVLLSLPKLTNLTVNRSQISNSGFRKLAQHPSINQLGIEASEIDDRALDVLPNATQLSRLSLLGNTRITDEGLRYLKFLPRLEHLDVSYGLITDMGLDHIAEVSTLKSLLFLNHDRTDRITDEGLKHLERSRSLRTLRMTRTSITPEGIASFKRALPMCEFIEQ